MNYVFANIPDPVQVLRDAAAIAEDYTVISVLTGYHPAQLAVSMFDYVNHDHLSFFTCSDFKRMADSIGLTVTYVREVPLKGGSIHVEMQKSGPGIEESTLLAMMMKREAWLDQPIDGQWRTVADRIALTKDKMQKELVRAQSDGLPIFGYGASQSTTTLIYALNIGAFIDVIVDDNAVKHGRFSPGLGIPVTTPERLKNPQRSCIVVLGWQHGPSIAHRLRQAGFRGRVVMPFPQFVVDDLS
jgi:hypothetical protein